MTEGEILLGSVQEARWKGEDTNTLGKDVARYQFFWKGIGLMGIWYWYIILLLHVDKVVEVKRI